MDSDELVRLFWGKSRGGVHPALFHMLDVGMVARAMVRRDPDAALRSAVNELGRGGDLPDRVGFLVSLHDLGKISPGFQNKVRSLTGSQRQAGFPFPAVVETDHGLSGLAELRGLLPREAREVARALAAHHGSFAANKPYKGERFGDGPWSLARRSAMSELASLYGVEATAPELSAGSLMALAGLTSVADWIGSDTAFFPPAGPDPPLLSAYAQQAEKQAEEALDAVGWRPLCGLAEPIGFQGQFGFHPNVLQARTAEIAEGLQEPACVVIEAPMGMGKTEAALHLADHLLVKAGHIGLYFALPTQATSGQMFRRVCEDYLDCRLAGSSADVLLLHGQAAFDETYEALRLKADPAPDPTDIHDEPGGTALAAGWFRGAKRGLLTPVAVGTIDQALMGALQCRHAFVRLYGLANKVVILDEVHAYDAYTTGLIERLVEWLAAMGSSVVILSATLPAERRRRLLKAYGAADAVEDGRYPRITVAARSRAAQTVTVQAPPQKPVRLVALTGGVAAALDQLANLLQDGGCAALLCNTVDGAQAAFLDARAHPGLAEAESDLLHARFPVVRRAELTRRIVDRYGRNGQRPKRGLVIATQVIEQSIDLDFDVMISDLAPIDLLLQRMGREHRHHEHDSTRPPRLQAPVLYWIEPDKQDHQPAFGVNGHVYDAWILLKTWLLLRDTPELSGAGQIEAMVEAVYGDAGPVVPEYLSEWAAGLEREWRNSVTNLDGWAEKQALRSPSARDPFESGLQLPDDPDQHGEYQRPLTRLGDPSVTVVCGVETGDPESVGLPDGGAAIDLSRPPDDEGVKRLLGASTRLSYRGWVAALNAESVPSAWRQAAPLRHCRLLRFHDGACRLGGLELWLDKDLGLVTSAAVRERLG